MDKNLKTYFLFLIFGSLVWVGIYWGLDFDGLYGQDAYEYVRYADRWAEFLLGGKPPGDYHWPFIYPVFGSIISVFTTIPITIVMQFISVVALSTNTYLVYRLLRIHYQDKKVEVILIISLLFFFAPYNFRSGVIVMSDQLAALFVLLTYYFFFQIIRGNKKLLLFIFGLAGFAIATRYIAVLLVVIPCLWLIYKERSSYKMIVIGCALALIPAVPHLYIRYNSTMDFLHNGALTTWSIKHFFMRSFETNYGVNTFFAPNILYAFSPFFHLGFSLITVFLCFQIKRLRWAPLPVIIVVSIGVYLFFIAGVETQNMRYFITCYPLVFFLMSWGALSWEGISKRVILIPLLCFQVGLSSWALSKTINANQIEKDIAAYLDDSRGKTIYSFGMDVSLQHYCPQHDFITLHLKNGFIPSNGSFCLFNTTWKHNRLKNTVPGEIYKVLSQNNKLKQVKQFNKGWVLYEVY